MGLINYKDIDFNQSINKETKKINFNGSDIEIVNYLSINDKYDLIMNTVSKSDEIDLYNSFKTKFYFDLNLVLMYSNLVLTEEDKQDELKLYDTLKRSGLMDIIINSIPETEKNDLWGNIMNIQTSMMNYRRSFNYFLNATFEKIPEIINKFKELLVNVDKNTMEQIKQLLFNMVTNNKNFVQEK